LRLEALEDRRVPTVLLDPLSQPKFVNALPNPLAPGFIFQPTVAGGTHYEINISQFQQSLGLVDPSTGAPLITTVWGYGNDAQPATYTGRTFVAQRDHQITVDWINRLVDSSGNPLPHLLPVDTSLHWANPLGQGQSGGPYTGPVPVVTHLHGGHNRSHSDGLPDAWFTPDSNDPDSAPDYTGRLFNPNYTYDNDQQAATLWYHDHALGITRLNVYAGLAGFYILRDTFDTGALDNPLNLPAAPYEIPIVIQDRMFELRNGRAELFYPSEPEDDDEPNPNHLPEFFGDVILANGQAWPVLDIEPRAYRLRLLNGSDSRFYNLSLPGLPIYQIGTDSGLLAAPVRLNQLTLGPGERADVIIDFSRLAVGGKPIILRNTAKSPFPGGEAVDPQTAGQIIAFRVSQPLNTAIPNEHVPTTLRPIIPLIQTGTTRGLLLFEGTDRFGRLETMQGLVDPSRPALDGSLAWDDNITENPQLNDVEVWEIYNSTADAHPIHLHLVSFQILSRQGFSATVSPKAMADDATGGVLSNVQLRGQAKSPAANEAGWKDTVVMYPGEVTRIIAKFDRTGEYVWHCHILSHEDHEMMRPYYVGEIPPGRNVATPVDGTNKASFSGLSGILTSENLGFAVPPAFNWALPAVMSGKSTFVFSSYDERPPTDRESAIQLPWWLF